MRNRREAESLARQIERESDCTVTGMRHYDDGNYAIDVTDKYGNRFTVASREDWESRKRNREQAKMPPSGLTEEE